MAVRGLGLAVAKDERGENHKDDNPGDGDEKATCHLKGEDGPATADDVAHGGDGNGLREEDGKVPLHSGHGLNRPDGAAEKEVRVEEAQGDHRRRVLILSQRWDEHSEAHAADALQKGQQENEGKLSVVGEAKDGKDEDHQRQWGDKENDDLRNEQGDENAQVAGAGDDASLNESLFSLDNEHHGCEGNGAEEGNGENGAGRHVVAVDGVLQTVHWLLHLDGHLEKGSAEAILLQVALAHTEKDIDHLLLHGKHH